VIINDLDIEHVAVLELEADAPLVVHADAPLTLAVAMQSLQAIARWCAHEVQRGSGIQLRELALGHGLDRAEAARAAAFE
jgi:hypothetical protein